MLRHAFSISLFGLLASCGIGPQVGDPFNNVLGRSGVASEAGSFQAASGTENERTVLIPIIDASSLQNIISLNYGVAGELIRTADEITDFGRAGNGVLILSGLVYALVNNNAPGSENLANGLLGALGLSEGLRFYGSRNTARAMLNAADQSTCIASVGAGGSASDPRSTADLIKKRNMEAALLWEATITIQTDLRRTITREGVSLTSLIDRFTAANPDSDISYDLAVAEQKLRALNRFTDAKDGTFEKKLFGCLAGRPDAD